MDTKTFWLALIPPAMALLIELCNPLSETKIENDADADLPNDLKSAVFYLETKYRVKVFGEATAEVAGLAPTLVASVTSGFAVLGDLEHPFGLTVIYTIIFLAVTVFVIRLLSGVTLFNVGHESISISLRRGVKIVSFSSDADRLTRQDVVKRVILLSNFFVISATILVFTIESLTWNELKAFLHCC